MGIYFSLTMLHAVHVTAGIGVFVWILSARGEAISMAIYFTPVDLAGLYWHLVDMIWILPVSAVVFDTLKNPLSLWEREDFCWGGSCTATP